MKSVIFIIFFFVAVAALAPEEDPPQCTPNDRWSGNVEHNGKKVCQSCACHPEYNWVCSILDTKCEWTTRPEGSDDVAQLPSNGLGVPRDLPRKLLKGCIHGSTYVKNYKSVSGSRECLNCICGADGKWNCRKSDKRCKYPKFIGSICKERKFEGKKELFICIECYCDNDDKLICDKITTGRRGKACRNVEPFANFPSMNPSSTSRSRSWPCAGPFCFGLITEESTRPIRPIHLTPRPETNN